jgi:hypothetical protein
MGRAPTDQLGLIAPLLLSLKLLKEIRQRPAARQPGREIGGKAIAPRSPRPSVRRVA